MAAYGDAVQREVDWLTEEVVGLPVLLKDQGGAFDLVLPYGRKAGSLPVGGRYMFVYREATVERRFAIQQKIQIHRLRLRVSWPVRAPGAQPEVDLAELDAAVEDILAKVRGPFGDHTHGGRFLDAAEGDEGSDRTGTEVTSDDPDTAIEQSKAKVEIRYIAVDVPFIA